MAAIVQAFVDGDLQRVSKDMQITSLCFLDAFTPERKEEIRQRYPGRVLTMEED